MIKITVEMFKFGNPENKKLIAKAFIMNDGTGIRGKGNYTANLFLKKNEIWKSIKVMDFPRQSYNVWKLLQRILNGIFEHSG